LTSDSQVQSVRISVPSRSTHKGTVVGLVAIGLTASASYSNDGVVIDVRVSKPCGR
jgi:hypothetical protein